MEEKSVIKLSGNDINLYEKISIVSSPILFLGTIIKDKHDHDRLTINARYNAKRLTVRGKLFYGVELPKNPRFFDAHPHRIRTIVNTPFNTERDQQIEMYKKRLEMYGLSCNTCFGYLHENIFPIDVDNLSKLTINSSMVNPNNLFVIEHGLDTPWFTQFTDPKIFILTNEC